MQDERARWEKRDSRFPQVVQADREGVHGEKQLNRHRSSGNDQMQNGGPKEKTTSKQGGGRGFRSIMP